MVDSGDMPTLPSGGLPGPAMPGGEKSGTAATPDPFAAFSGPILLGRYQLGRELARGGMGRVVLACDRQLERVVAVKEMLDSSEEARARFLRETRITAQLQHPAIISVYESGAAPSGEPFYVMRQVPGHSLAEALDGRTTPNERLGLLPHLIAATEALSYAHGRGVVHRDLKPGNILVGPFGETVVIDWGLARRLDEAESAFVPLPTREPSKEALTQLGSVMGTPAYMAPEQARGETVDARADVYALGAILRELLTGKPPYDGDRPSEVVSAVLASEPPRLDPVALGMPGDLVAIVSKAMARDRLHRYPDASALAAELRLFQAGQRVAAHRYSRGELFERWVRRHRAELAVGALALVALVAVGIGASVQVLRERDAARQGQQQARLEVARELINVSPTRTLDSVRQLDPDLPGWDEARFLAEDALSRGVARWSLEVPGTSALAVAADGRRLAVGTQSGAIWVWDREAPAVRRAGQVASEIQQLAISFDDQWLAAAGPDGVVTALNLRSGESRPLGGSAAGITNMAFLADGTLAIERRGARFELWNTSGERLEEASGVDRIDLEPRIGQVAVGQGSEVRIYGHHPGGDSIAIPEGWTLFTVAPSGPTASIQNGERVVGLAQAGKGLLGTFARAIGGGFVALAFADEHRLVALQGPNQYQVLELGQEPISGSIGCPARDVDFVSPGKVVFACDHRLEFLDLDTGDRRTQQVDGLVRELPTLSANGALAAAQDRNGKVLIWDLNRPTHAARHLPIVPRELLRSDSGRLVAVGAMSDAPILLDLDPESLETRRTFGPFTQVGRPATGPSGMESRPMLLAVLSPDGSTVAWADAAGTVAWVNLESGQIATRTIGGVEELSFDRQGQLLVASPRGWTVFNVRDGTRMRDAALDHTLDVIPGPTADTLLVLDTNDHLSVRGENGDKVADLEGASGFARVSRDGRHVIAARGGDLVDWTVGEWGPPHSCHGDGDLITALSISADGATVATGDALGHLTRWNVQTCARQPIPGVQALTVAFELSADRRQLLVNSPEHGELQLIDIGSGSSWAFWHTQPLFLSAVADWSRHRFFALTTASVESWTDDAPADPRGLLGAISGLPNSIQVPGAGP